MRIWVDLEDRTSIKEHLRRPCRLTGQLATLLGEGNSETKPTVWRGLGSARLSLPKTHYDEDKYHKPHTGSIVDRVNKGRAIRYPPGWR